LLEYQTELTDEAIEDVSDIYNYIQRDSVYYAMKTKNEIEKRIQNLSFMPFMGRRLVDSKKSRYFKSKRDYL